MTIAEDVLRPGDRMRLSVPGTPLRGLDVVLREVGPAHLRVHVARNDMSHPVLRDDGPLAARVARPDIGACTFETRLEAIWLDSPAPHVLAAPDRIEIRQERRHVRLPIVVDLGYAHDGDARSGCTVDVSAGGMGILTDEPIPVGSTIQTRCAIPGRAGVVDVDCTARVVRQDRRDDTDRRLAFRHGIEFVDLTDRSQDEIMGSVLWNLASRRVA